jgi:hypothetical protein
MRPRRLWTRRGTKPDHIFEIHEIGANQGAEQSCDIPKRVNVIQVENECENRRCNRSGVSWFLWRLMFV